MLDIKYSDLSISSTGDDRLVPGVWSKFDTEDVCAMTRINAAVQCERLCKGIRVIGPDIELGIVRARGK